MKKIGIFSLFLALLLLFSFTSCEDESGEITTEYTATVSTEAVSDETNTATDAATDTTEEVTSAGIDLGGMTEIPLNPPETTAAPEVTTAPETTAAPEVTTAPEETTESEVYEEYNPAPDFTVYDRNGNPVRFSDMLGKPIVLNFWASWCGPCKAEMPDFDEVCRLLGDEVVFMMVNLTDGRYETAESATAFIDSMGYAFPVYLDLSGDAAYYYGIESIPTTFFISARGNFVAYASGALDYETLLYGISLINY